MGATFEEVRKVSTDDDESPRSPLVSSSPTGDLSDCELRSVCALWSEAFPTAPGRDRYAEALARLDGAAEAREQVHAVFEADGACVAAARTFVRVVSVGGGDRRVLALAHVATAPRARGRGLGALVFRAAMERLSTPDDGVEESLFCTGVPAFYERLGAAVLAPLDVAYAPAGAKPFADPTFCRVATPKAPRWPDGPVVLRANGAGW